MLQILGIGHAHPETVVDNRFLESLDLGMSADQISQQFGVEQRRSAFPLSYILETKNADPRNGWDLISETPTDLSLRAAEMAIERAGISADQINLIIGDSTTPRETTPSEAQRIGKQLGLKCRAYDVTSGGASFAMHLNLLSSWKADRVPEYVLIIYSGSLTQVVDYRNIDDAAICGDGAAAVVVSLEHPGKLSVSGSSFNTSAAVCDEAVVETLGHFRQRRENVENFVVSKTKEMLDTLESQHNIDWQKDFLVGPQQSSALCAQACNGRTIATANGWSNVAEFGYCSGASAPSVISMNWDRLQSQERIAVALAGFGMSWGSAVLEVN